MALGKQRPYWYVNPTSRIVFQSALITVAETGGWFDIYLNGSHYTGTADLARAIEIFGAFNQHKGMREPL